MKIFLDLATPDSPVHKAIVQIFTTIGGLEFVKTVQEADGIMTDEPEKAQVYLDNTSKRVAQVLWCKQIPATIPESDRFKIFNSFPGGKMAHGMGLIEAMAFLKGQ